MKLYGITNCDTVKKARLWLAEKGHDIPFHDFKKAGVDRDMLKHWLGKADWQDLVNKRGTTWRQLSDEEKAAVQDEATAIELMLRKPTVIKRPILESGGRVVVGFDEKSFSECLQNERA